MQKLLNQFKNINIAKYLIASVLIIVPLYPKFPFINIPGTYVSIRFEDLLILALAVVSFFSLLKNKNIFTNLVFRAMFIFLFIGAISLISSILITQTVSLHIGLLHLFRRLEYMIPLISIFLLFKSKSLSNVTSYYFGIILTVVFILFIYGFGQRYFSFPIIVTQNQEYSKGIALRYTPGSHINSTFAGHYDLASFMVIVLPILISSFFMVTNKYHKFIIAIIFAMGLWLLVNSLSRIAQVSYLIAIFISLFSLKRYKEFFLISIISILLILSTSGLYQRFSRFFNVYASDDLIQTPKQVEVYEDRSTNIRLAVEWPRALRAFYKNPIFGTGYSSINLATDNDYLRALGETGAFGLIAFLYLIFVVVKQFISRYPFRNFLNGLELAMVTGFFGGFVGTLVTAFFIDIFEASKFAIIFWTFAGYCILLLNTYKNEIKN